MKYSFIFCFCTLLLSHVAEAQMQLFDLKEVRLKEGPFKNAQDVDLKYILELNPDRLLAPYLIASGIPVKAERYGNWESIGLDGHIAGHYLSALAMMYASTGNTEVKNRLDYMISELEKCQQKNGCFERPPRQKGVIYFYQCRLYEGKGLTDKQCQAYHEIIPPYTLLLPVHSHHFYKCPEFQFYYRH